MVILPKASPKVEGVSSRKSFKARIKNLDELIKAVADGKVDRTFLFPKGVNSVEMSELNRRAQLTEGKMEIPGVETFEDRTHSFSRK